MSDRPILFSAPMVRALLAGRKTQTRRILKPQPTGDVWRYGWDKDAGATFSAGDELTSGRIPIWAGDRLWVRETLKSDSNDQGHAWITYAADGAMIPSMGAYKWQWARDSLSSIHMPRWASRLTLTVTDVKVERLQDITLRDAFAEGCAIRQIDLFGAEGEQRNEIGRAYYRSAWEAINGPGSWKANPFVVAYTFTVIKQNIDQIGRAAA